MNTILFVYGCRWAWTWPVAWTARRAAALCRAQSMRRCWRRACRRSCLSCALSLAGVLMLRNGRPRWDLRQPGHAAWEGVAALRDTLPIEELQLQRD